MQLICGKCNRVVGVIVSELSRAQKKALKKIPTDRFVDSREQYRLGLHGTTLVALYKKGYIEAYGWVETSRSLDEDENGMPVGKLTKELQKITEKNPSSYDFTYIKSLIHRDVQEIEVGPSCAFFL